MEPGNCFAYRGVNRFGVIDNHQCGTSDRINGWFDGPGLKYETTPKFDGCMTHSQGKCFQEHRFVWP